MRVSTLFLDDSKRSISRMGTNQDEDWLKNELNCGDIFGFGGNFYLPEFDTLKVRKTKKKLAGDCCSGDFQPTNFFWVCNVF